MNAPDPNTPVRHPRAHPIDRPAEADGRAAWMKRHTEWHRLARPVAPPHPTRAGTWLLLVSCVTCWLVLGLAAWSIWPAAPDIALVMAR